jgi:hypothetical protein
MRMNALMGRITEAPNLDSKVDIDIQYPVTTFTPNTLWDDTVNADPMLDILNMTRERLTRGIAYDTMIAPDEVIFNLMMNEKMRNVAAIRNVTGTETPSFIDIGQISAQTRRFGITVVPYRAVYTTRTDDGAGNVVDTSHPILPRNKVIFLRSSVQAGGGAVRCAGRDGRCSAAVAQPTGQP